MREDFQSDAEYIRARIDWGVEQGISKAKESEMRRELEAQISEAKGKYNSRMIALKAEDPEIEELVQPGKYQGTDLD